MMKTIIIVLLFLANSAQADCGGILAYKVKSKILQCSSPVLNKISNKLKKFKILSEYVGIELITSHGKVFVQKNTGLSCKDIKLNEIVKISIELSCCDGDPNAPCLLGYDKKAVEIEPTT